jgi:hypothetical protein
MECDSRHSAIEHAKKRTHIRTSQWDTVVRMARQNKPYTVIPMKHKDFLDFKPLAKQTISKVQKDVDDKNVNWLNMKWIQYRKSEPDFIYFKYDFDEQFKAIKIRRSGRNTPSIPCKFTG